VFFCVGTTTLNAILDSLRENPNVDPDDSKDFVKIIATSFPNAAPFYVGWLVFQTALHSGFELGLCMFISSCILSLICSAVF